MGEELIPLDIKEQIINKIKKEPNKTLNLMPADSLMDFIKGLGTDICF